MGTTRTTPFWLTRAGAVVADDITFESPTLRRVGDNGANCSPTVTPTQCVTNRDIRRDRRGDCCSTTPSSSSTSSSSSHPSAFLSYRGSSGIISEDLPLYSLDPRRILNVLEACRLQLAWLQEKPQKSLLNDLGRPISRGIRVEEDLR